VTLLSHSFILYLYSLNIGASLWAPVHSYRMATNSDYHPILETHL